MLVILPTWVGDFVMATPLLRAIRRRFDGARITFLLEPNLLDLARGGEWMDDCVAWPDKAKRRPWNRDYLKLVAELRRRRFAWAIILPNSFRSALIARLSGARRRIGYDRDGRGWLLTDRVPVKNRYGNKTSEPRTDDSDLSAVRADSSGKNTLQDTTSRRLKPAAQDIPDRAGSRYRPLPLVEYYGDLAEAFGCKRPSDQLELFTMDKSDQAVQERLASLGIEDRHPLVVMSVGAKYGAAKCWLPERFAAVGDRLAVERGAAVIVTCGPGEEHIARQISEAMREDGLIFDQPLLSLGELKSLIKRSDLLLCNDTGPRHFAKAFGVPVVTIFGPTHPQWTRTGYEAERIVRIDIECGPCQQRICPLGHLDCMKGVTVDMVFDACVGLLKAEAKSLAP